MIQAFDFGTLPPLVAAAIEALTNDIKAEIGAHSSEWARWLKEQIRLTDKASLFRCASRS